MSSEFTVQRIGGHDEAMISMPVPPDADASTFSSMTDAVRQAVSILIDSGQAPILLKQADDIAALATKVGRPGGDLLADRLARMRTVREVFEQGDWLTAEELNALQEKPPENKSHPASDWKRRGRIFSVTIGQAYFARYQFDALYQPLPVIKDVLQAFGPVADPWTLAAWFFYPNGWLGDADGHPLAPKDALDHADEVIHAARMRSTSYVA